MSVPYQKLRLFMERLGLDEKELEHLFPFREIFINKKEEFAERFYFFFHSIPETRIIIENLEKSPGALRKDWAGWFGKLFQLRLDDEFLGYLWKIGVRHVEINLDQRYSNLGFSVVRQFCEKVIVSEIPAEKAAIVSKVIAKLLDLCLLVETSAYIETTSRCDMEIIRGVADRIRNRVMVIGGNIKRLQKKTDAADPTYTVYESLITESSSCERMVIDIRTYMDMYQKEPEAQRVPLEELISRTLQRLHVKERFNGVRIDTEFDTRAAFVLSDPSDIEGLFYHLIENSLEAVDAKNPYIKISSSYAPSLPGRLSIEIFNTVTPLKLEDMEKLMSPFYSTKPGGSGFGLPIARLALRKNYGSLSLEPVAGQGTRVVISLPVPEE
ncbi:MAG: hypothetical protein HY756_08555 [Nitrospirae bacterium]|nr:hypothetical protein [Nitrospirota bacterium]